MILGHCIGELSLSVVLMLSTRLWCIGAALSCDSAINKEVDGLCRNMSHALDDVAQLFHGPDSLAEPGPRKAVVLSEIAVALRIWSQYHDDGRRHAE